MFVVYGMAIMIGVSGNINCGAQIFTSWFGMPLWAAQLVYYMIAGSVVFIGMKAVGVAQKYAVVLLMGIVAINWKMGSCISRYFSLFALLTTFWSNTLALRDVVHEQIGIGNRISWLVATVPCILFAIFGVNSFIILTRIMSGVVVLVSIMLVLTYGKSRRKAGKSPICGIIGTVPFQILMVLSTVVLAIGSLIPLS